MKYLSIITAVMLITFGTIIGMNGSQVCFVFILAGIVVALYGIRKEVA